MCIMAGCVILSIGAALQATAYTIPHMIVGRIVAGIGNGLNTSTIRKLPSAFMEECSSKLCSCVAFGVEQGC